MDGLTYLALAAKAKLVFEHSDTFLSFPATTPMNYTADKLNFGAFDSKDNSQRLVYSEFARIVNSLPSGTIYEMGDKFLWEVYSKVLATAIRASSQASAEDTAAYERAVAFLNVVDGSGLKTASPQLLAYRQYRDAWLVAVQNYKAQQSTAAALTDQAAITQWTTVDEPRLRAQVEEALSDWQTKGFKKQVEDAQQAEQEYAALSPDSAWPAFDSNIDVLTDPIGQQFAPTSFVPSDVFSEDWLTFSIAGPEISRLVATAPDELKKIFGGDTSQSAVDALSFEYRAVSVTRYWFQPEIFDARYWRLPEGSEPLSDGGDPPKGEWPAYIAAVVFMRNLRVVMHTDHPGQPQIIRALPTFKYVMAPTVGAHPQLRLATVPPAAHAVPVATPPHPMPAASVHTAPLASARFAVVTPMRMATPVRPPGPIRVIAPIHPIVVPPSHATGNSGQSSPPQPPATPKTDTNPDPKNDISILAFICKRLSKTPNPDPNLNWNGKTTP